MSLDIEREYEELVQEIRSCKRCPLHACRRNPVPGEGNLRAEVMLIGEAPGEKEDEQGRPFVGAAGNLLTKLLSELGVRREDVYITNVLKCRPPNNRDPEPEEIAACLPFLVRQIRIIRPKLIICLGRHSAREILKLAGYRESEVSQISRIRGRVYEVVLPGDVKTVVIPTYHPAAALYNPRLRTYLQEDLRKAFSLIREGLPRRKSSILDFLS